MQTEDLLTLGKLNRPGEKIIELRAVILHWLEAPNQRPIDTRSHWETERDFGSAHYVIGTDGFILRTIPEDEIGYHVGSSRIDPASGRVYTDRARALFGPDAFTGKSPRGYLITPNYYSIGIEMSHLNMYPGDFTEATLQAAAELVAEILKRHRKSIAIVATHNEIVGWKDCPRLWTNNPVLFEEFKDRTNTILEAA